jgi:hypothetical protein
MATSWKEITVNWGESDPFGLVYCPRILAWFNDTEHELFRRATRVSVRINEDGTLKAQSIPLGMLNALRELGDLKHLQSNSGLTKLAAERS